MGRRGGPSGPPARLRVEVVTSTRTRVPGLSAWLASAAPALARGDVTVAITSDSRVRTLNRRFRRKDTSTDVLSFPSGDPADEVRRGPAFVRPGVGRALTARQRYLGDIVIAAGVAARQARVAGHSPGTEIRVLALHGLLHLLGYDHERDDGQMARLERRLRRKAGLVEGLIERG
ncbi:MAG: rRNA maturation RNase YbeY [Vicinamibacterales bacterium]